MTAPQAVASTSLELLDRLVASQLPATWALNDFADSLLGDRVAAVADQEIALLANRDEFEHDGRALTKHLSNRRAARSVSTIVGEGWGAAQDLEALARVGITALRTRYAPPPRRWFEAWRSSTSVPKKSVPKKSTSETLTSAKSSELRWGLRPFAPTLSLPVARRSALHRALSDAIAGGSIVLVIDVVGVAISPRASLLAITAIEQLAASRNESSTEILTLREVVAKLDNANRGRPTQSILRASA